MPLRWIVLLAGLLFAGAAAPASEQDLLQPEQAYRLSVRALDAKTLEVRYQIAQGYYLYRDKFRFAAEPASVKLGEPRFPPGKRKTDEFFGEVETYRDELVIPVPFTAPEGVKDLKLTVTSQGCADVGVCFPPTAQSVSVRLTGTPAPAAPARAPDAVPGDESSQVAQMLRKAGFWLAVASFFGFGALLTFTPCVFPMIPILSGIIIGQGHDITKRRAFGLSLAYVIGMAVTYAAAGVAAGLSGRLLSAALQNAWVLGAFAALFVVLALSMFGLYELQLPSALQSRLTVTAGRRKGGSVTGVVTMGALSALICGPCVAAPLAGALLYIAQTRDALLGAAALFAMGLGMGAPLIVLAVSARSLLPKAGAWMDAIKKFFGVALLAVAIWIVSPVLPAAATMVAWALLLIFPAIHLHALDPLPVTAGGLQRFWKGVGVLCLLTGASLFIGALAGNRDPLQPLAGLRGAAAQSPAPVAFERVRTVAELDARLANTNRPVMLDFYADWCVSCKEFERYTFTDPAVRDRLKRMVLLQADVTANSEEDRALLQRFNLFGPPGIVFFDRTGKEISGVRVVGYQPAEQFAAVLDRVLQPSTLRAAVAQR